MRKQNVLGSLSLWLVVFGFLSIIFYFLHVVFGTINYPGYDSLSQAVSDLTSDDSPAKTIARLFSSFYGIMSSLVALGLIYAFKKDDRKILKAGIICLSIMYLVSAVGYGLFPLSSAQNVNSFQDTMHIVVTIIVVLLTIVSLSLLIFGFKKAGYIKYQLITFLTLLTIFLGSILSGILPKEFFGLAERFSVFGVVLFLGVIVVFNYFSNLGDKKSN